MSDIDFRLLVALKFALGPGDYATQRRELETISWRVVDKARAHGYFCDVLTFPNWNDTKEMLDFGWIHDNFKINTWNCLCIRIKRSPISDEVATDIQHVCDSDSICGKIICSMLKNENAIDSAIEGNPVCKSKFDRTPPVLLLNAFLNLSAALDCFILYTSDFSADKVHLRDRKRALYELWAHWVCCPQKALAIQIRQNIGS